MSEYQLSVKILGEYQLSVNPIQTLLVGFRPFSMTTIEENQRGLFISP